MKLSRYTDYALRVLMYLGANQKGLSSIRSIAMAYNISQSHLMKVVQDLGNAGYIKTTRGRHGGIRLGREAQSINLGDLIKHTEVNPKLVDCGGCAISPLCTLPRVLNEAMRGFYGVLERYTLQDLLKQPSQLFNLLEPKD